MRRFPLACLCAAALLLAAGLLLLPRFSAAGPSGPGDSVFLLSDRGIDQVLRLSIRNQYDSYTVRQEGGGFMIEGLPMEQANPEYVRMLLEESARVEYGAAVAGGKAEPELYGLDGAQAEIAIDYADGEHLTLLLGNEEPVSAGRYFMEKGAEDVLLMKNSRALRFLMPREKFIHYEIVPFAGFPSPLSAVKNLRLSGRAFPRDIVIEELRGDSVKDMRDASSFGVATHLIRSPGLHEIDQTECIEVFASLTGLLNKDVLAYNCTDGELDAYGFNDPLAKAEFDFQIDADSPPEHIVLRVAPYQGGYILVRDDQRIVHLIENEAFIRTSYEKLAMRWFLTPFITDLESLALEFEDGKYPFIFRGEGNRDLEVLLDGKPLAIGRFRKFYTLLTSAANDGVLLDQPVPETRPLMSLVFNYKDPLKAPDTMRLFKGALRRVNVEVNGRTEFAMLQKYLDAVKTAAAALPGEGDFTAEW
ncbi:MAG: DUF4340 domain-containing protein [Spirochaetaceae bacterium]|nr:DUF4340 domain-containing protein [Spirochaetaceae bacterium]